jgi:hypothetical protein
VKTVSNLSAKQLKNEYRKAHIRVLSCVNEPEKHKLAIARRDVIGELLHDYFGLTKLELETLLVEFTAKCGGDTDDKV